MGCVKLIPNNPGGAWTSTTVHAGGRFTTLTFFVGACCGPAALSLLAVVGVSRGTGRGEGGHGVRFRPPTMKKDRSLALPPLGDLVTTVFYSMYCTPLLVAFLFIIRLCSQFAVVFHQYSTALLP